jgi:hypothetical protein
MRKFFLVAAAAAIALVGITASACDSGEKKEQAQPEQQTTPEPAPAPEPAPTPEQP